MWAKHTARRRSRKLVDGMGKVSVFTNPSPVVVTGIDKVVSLPAMPFNFGKPPADRCRLKRCVLSVLRQRLHPRKRPRPRAGESMRSN